MPTSIKQKVINLVKLYMTHIPEEEYCWGNHIQDLEDIIYDIKNNIADESLHSSPSGSGEGQETFQEVEDLHALCEKIAEDVCPHEIFGINRAQRVKDIGWLNFMEGAKQGAAVMHEYGRSKISRLIVAIKKIRDLIPTETDRRVRQKTLQDMRSIVADALSSTPPSSSPSAGEGQPMTISFENGEHTLEALSPDEDSELSIRIEWPKKWTAYSLSLEEAEELGNFLLWHIQNERKGNPPYASTPPPSSPSIGIGDARAADMALAERAFVLGYFNRADPPASYVDDIADGNLKESWERCKPALQSLPAPDKREPGVRAEDFLKLIKPKKATNP